MNEPQEGQERASRIEPAGDVHGEPVYDQGPSLIWLLIPILLFALLVWFSRTS